MRIRWWTAAFAACSFISLLPQHGLAQPRTFEVLGGGKSRGQFVSDAPLETMKGVARGVSGELTVDPADLSTAKATIKVEVASLRTGIDLRDEHLRGKDWLDAGKFKHIVFELTEVSGVKSLPDNKAVKVTVKGKLTMHGVTRNITTKARVRYKASDGSLRVQTGFGVKLEDHGVSVPSVVRFKIANEIQVKMDLKAKAK